MNYVATSSSVGRIPKGLYLRGWYPGIGEVHAIQTLPLFARRFLAEACEEDPEFLSEYLIPTLGELNAADRILLDLADAITDHELEQEGLGELANLGKSFFKKIGQAIKKVAKVVGKATGVKQVEQAAKFTVREVKKEVKATEKIAKKYGNVILTVAGAVLAPFTGGASLAAASLLVAANTMYQKKKAADAAKKAARADASSMTADASAQEAQTTQQVNDFYSQNQQWFQTQLGVTPASWGQLTLAQKIDLINSGASGTVPGAAPVEPPPSPAPAPMPPSSIPPSMGPSGGGGGAGPSAPGPSMVPGASDGGADFQLGPSPSQRAPAAGPAGPQVADAGIFSGSGFMVPAAIVIAAVLMSQGSGSRGGSRGRPRRNPGRRNRLGSGRGKSTRRALERRGGR